jgi:ribose-phosphate pyrophosphokinase
MKCAELLREQLEAELGRPIGKGLAEKHRSAGIVSGDLFVGDIAGTTALIVDDLISTGHTLLRAARSARAGGARRVMALVTHALFMPGSSEVLANPALDRVVVSDSVPPFRLEHPERNDKLILLPSAPLLAEAIRRLHEGRSLTDLSVF